MEPTINANTPANKSKNKSTDQTMIAYTSPDQSKAPIEANHVEQKGKNPYDRITLWIAFFALIASISAACFSWWQASIAKDTAVRQLRAYVGPGPRGHLTYSPVTGEVGVAIDLNNTGQTPAYKTCYVGRVKILPYPRGDRSIFEDFPLNISEGREKASATIPSQGHSVANLINDGAERFTTEQLNGILANPSKRIFAFGIMEYYDIFKIKRTTKFCMSFGSNIPLQHLKMGEFRPDVIVAENTVRDNDAD